MTMAQRIAVWHGSDDVLRRLVQAVLHNCQCDGTTGGTCEAHKMLVDQNVLDHMAFVWKARMRYYHGEFTPEAEWW